MNQRTCPSRSEPRCLRLPCIERLLEEFSQRQPVLAGEPAEALAGFFGDLDAQLLPSDPQDFGRPTVTTLRAAGIAMAFHLVS